MQTGAAYGSRSKITIARLSVLSNLLLVLLKLAVGIFINSVSVLSEAVHSGIDLLAALLSLFAVSRSATPPDEDHQYGHGKYENVSGIVEALLIFLAAAWIIVEAVHKLIAGGEVRTPVWGLAVMGLSGVVNLVMSSSMMKIARATDSIALEADAWNRRTDIYTSAGVAAGMLLIWLTGRSLFDPLLAIVVAILIIKTSFDLLAKAFSPLLDASLPLEEEDAIKQIIDNYGGPYVGFHELRTRKAGSERHIDLHLVVPKSQNIAVSHGLCDQIEQAVKAQYPEAHVLIHVEPCQEGDDCLSCPVSCGSVKGDRAADTGTRDREGDLFSQTDARP